MVLGRGPSLSTQDVKITLTRNGVVLKEAHADKQGKFSFLKLTEGDYEVKIEAAGYQSYERRVTLRYPGKEEERFSAYLRPDREQIPLSPQDVSRRITEQRVWIDLLALDSRGNYVTSLLPEDLQIFENGKERRVEHLIPYSEILRREWIWTTGLEANPPAPAESLSSLAIFRNGSPVTAFSVIAVDGSALAGPTGNLVLRSARLMLERHLQIGNAVMLVEIGARPRTHEPFSRNEGRLRAGLERMIREASSIAPAKSDGSRSGPFSLPLWLEAVKSLSYSLEGIEGRKQVILFSRSLPASELKDKENLLAFHQAVTVANSVGASFYTIDAGKLEFTPELMETPTRSLTEKEQIETFLHTSQETFEDPPDLLTALAAATNGSSLRSQEDEDRFLEASVAEQDRYLLVGFTPASEGKGRDFRRLALKSRKGNFYLRARTGYHPETLRQFDAGRRSASLLNPELFRHLLPEAQIETGKKKTRIVTGVSADQIAFLSREDQYHAEILFLGQIYGEDGNPLSKNPEISRGFNLSLTAEQFRSLGRQPLFATSELEIPPGDYRLVLLVEDHLRGLIGSSVREFSVPRRN